MRTASTRAELYAFHDACLRGERPPVFEDEPQCGWYRMQMVRGGPWLAVRIWCEADIDPETGELADDERLLCEINGIAERRLPWPRCANKPITQDAYRALLHDEGLTETLQATHAPVDLTERAIRP
jgi:hypothetical protein